MPRYNQDDLSGIGQPAPAYRPPPPATTNAPAPAPAAPTAFDQSYAAFSADPNAKDTEQYNPAQWDAWKQQENQLRAGGGGAQNCPPNLPFTGRGGQCAAKPDDCPDGTHVEGSDTNGSARCTSNTQQQQPQQQQTQAGAPAASPAPAAPSGPPPGPSTFTPPQVVDPLAVSGLGSAGIQYNPSSGNDVSAAGGATQQTDEQKKKQQSSMSGLGGSSAATPGTNIGLGMH